MITIHQKIKHQFFYASFIFGTDIFHFFFCTLLRGRGNVLLLSHTHTKAAVFFLIEAQHEILSIFKLLSTKNTQTYFYGSVVSTVVTHRIVTVPNVDNKQTVSRVFNVCRDKTLVL